MSRSICDILDTGTVIDVPCSVWDILENGSVVGHLDSGSRVKVSLDVPESMTTWTQPGHLNSGRYPGLSDSFSNVGV